jgi:hypothetical protein
VFSVEFPWFLKICCFHKSNVYRYAADELELVLGAGRGALGPELDAVDLGGALHVESS